MNSYTITVDATSAVDDTQPQPHQGLQYRAGNSDARKFSVTGKDTVVWELQAKLKPPAPNSPKPDLGKVHLFILFPPGKSAFSNCISFHTTGLPGAKTNAGTVKVLPSAQDSEYYVAVIDENTSPPTVSTDDPIISNSGSGGLDGMIAYLEAAFASVMAMGDRPTAKKLQEVIHEAIQKVKTIQAESR
jgi:hypothetical protein